MSFLEFLKTNASEVDQSLQNFLDIYIGEVSTINPRFRELLTDFKKSCEGGKRIRAALVRLGYQMAEGDKSFEEDVLKIALAYEIFQTAILAHDDIIDKSELRRGEPSLYMRLGGGHYGISQAIVLADIGFFLTVKLINETQFTDSIKTKAVSAFTETFLKTGLGEMLDVEISFKRDDVDISDVNTVNILKTADYSVVGPLTLGIILSGKNDELISDIKRFGEDLGVAFQLQDDILGVIGQESETGKSVSSDIEEGKMTVLYLKALENSNSSQKEFLNQKYGQNNLSETDIEEIRDIFKTTGAVEYCKNKSAELINKAKESIEEMDISDVYKQTLQAMSDFLIERTK